MHKKEIVFLTGGGTAGHIYPLIAVVNELRTQRKDLSFVYIGSGLKIEKSQAKDATIKYKKILTGKFRRNISIASVFLNIIDLFKFTIGILQSIILFLKFRPTIVFSKGGYVSLPVVLAGSLFKTPMISHESDLLPGLANRIALRFSSRIGLAFPLGLYPVSIRNKGFYCGIPLRNEFEKFYNKKGPEEHILVIGGSSGAINLNSLIFQSAESILEREKLIHLTGESDYDRAILFRQTLPSNLKDRYQIIKYSDKIPELIFKSKLVVTRAGATALFEIASCNKKALIVPIQKDVTEHQSINALFLKDQKMAEVHFEDQPASDFVKKVEKLLDSKDEPVIKNMFFPKSVQVLSRVISDKIDNAQFCRINEIFMIGIGGVSMKGLANVLRKIGKKVTGSDIRFAGHSATNINIGQELIIYTSAARKDSPAKDEIDRANQLDIPMLKRSEAIGLLMKGSNGLSVTGMHGKTTVSSLLSRVLEGAGKFPSYLIGAENSDFNKTYNLGKGTDFVVEACEYDDSFMDFPTSTAILLNIEEEHLDYFKGGLPQIKEHFKEFISRIYPGGNLIYCADDENINQIIEESKELLKENRINVVSYGFNNDAMFSIKNYKVENLLATFDIKSESKSFSIRSKVMGKHFALNATGVFAAGSSLFIEPKNIVHGIENFRGAARRFEFKGERRGIKIYDDYGHHPTEIKVTLDALEEMYPNNRKILIYEPHQQSRMNNFYKQFVEVFSKSNIDFIGILPVYKIIGRDEKEKYSSENLVAEILKNGKSAGFFESYQEANSYMQKNLKKGDILMTMGATNIDAIADEFLS